MMEKCPFSGAAKVGHGPYFDVRSPYFRPVYRGSDMWEEQKPERNEIAGVIIAKSLHRFVTEGVNYPPYGLVRFDGHNPCRIDSFTTPLPAETEAEYPGQLSALAVEVSSEVRTTFLHHLNQTLQIMSLANPGDKDFATFKRLQLMTWRYDIELLEQLLEDDEVDDLAEFEEDETAWASEFIAGGVRTAFDKYIQIDNGIIDSTKKDITPEYVAETAVSSYPSLALLAATNLNPFAVINRDHLEDDIEHLNLDNFELVTGKNGKDRLQIDRELWTQELAKHAGIVSASTTKCPALTNLAEYSDLAFPEDFKASNSIRGLLLLNSSILQHVARAQR